MLRLVYVASLFAVAFVAGSGIAYCGWLILSGDQNGLINLGKCLILFLYSTYRIHPYQELSDLQAVGKYFDKRN
jgi:hypothetical protein